MTFAIPYLDVQSEEVAWWKKLLYPTVMFPDLPHIVAIILYSCIVVGIFIILLALLWLCTSLSGKKKMTTTRNTSLRMHALAEQADKTRSLWSTTGQNRPKHFKTSSKTLNHQQRNGDTLKQLETLPWWDYVSNNPAVNWYDYYRMVEGKNRSRTCDRRRPPWKTSGARRCHTRNESDKQQWGSPDIDPSWEKVRPRNVDMPWYWRSPRTLDTRFFPRFRLIPRASWSNERLLGCISSNPIDYGTHSVASLTSTDMQIMQMVAERERGYIRPGSGDVFFGQYLGPVCGVSPMHRTGNASCNSVPPISPYDVHNQNVARRQASRASPIGENSQNLATQCSSTPLPGLPRNPDSNSTDLRETCTPLPSPPEYPPPPTPLRRRSDVGDA